MLGKIEGKRKRGWQRMQWLDGITDSTNMNLRKILGDGEGQGILLGHSPVQFSSVQSLSRVWLFATHGLQHARPPCPSPTPRACSNSCPLSQRCHPTISSSVVPFSSCLQSFPVSGSFLMSQWDQSMGWSRVTYNLATEQKQQESTIKQKTLLPIGMNI